VYCISSTRRLVHGGGEGGAEYCEAVFAFGGGFFQVSYSYASHCGHDYDYIEDTVKEVFPKKVTQTVYS